ncbi:MAG: DNA polymerase III subunit gamma/tau [Acidimicrobiales bacterium]|nr:DNA polymerase III subunit gamma/tau [Acidimicrobiales bacterium]MDG2217052.1 DNA polymerase III subunit gamma/tau [Acidimicrobiales bacterium]
MAYQSLYRRYRPQRFSDIRGQKHVVSALQNAVVKGEVGHAYLLHGPRGTGKTTSARVLAKALNCENLGEDGEPCGECESCVAIEHGRSFDLHELDAASNNKVEDMRDLLSKVNLGNPGRAKVYILDEVHMLTSQAENALLKTLEEPPDHVTWVLATTEPHKVVDTIRSRCQVFELSLLGADELSDHVRWIIEDANLEVDEAAIDYVISAGGGSARDTLSALDRVVAAGGVVEIDTSTDTLLDSLATHDVAAALAAVGDATGRGRDPRTIGEGVLSGLRDGFLTAMGAPPPRLSVSARERAERLAGSMSPAAMTRSLEALGIALVEMRQAPDPRVDLEVVLVRLCRPATDRSLDAIIERLERLEQQMSGGAPASAAIPAATTPAAAPVAPTPEPVAKAPVPAPIEQAELVDGPPVIPASATPAIAPAPPVDKSTKGPAAAARRALAEKRAGSAAAPGPSETPPPSPVAPPPVPPALSDSAMPELGEIRPESPREVVELAAIHFGLESSQVVKAANDLLGESSGKRSPDELAALWAALVADYGPSTVPASVAGESPLDTALAPVADEPPPYDDGAYDPEPLQENPGPAGDDEVDVHDLVDAPSHTEDLIDRLTEAFPGAELHVSEDEEHS